MGNMASITQKDLKTILKHKKFLGTLPNVIKKRRQIISKHLPNFYLQHKIKANIDNKIVGYIGKTNPHQNIFFASSVGFTKMTWNKNVESILDSFKLGFKLENASWKNMKKYEKLKYLIIRYYERKKEIDAKEKQ